MLLRHIAPPARLAAVAIAMAMAVLLALCGCGGDEFDIVGAFMRQPADAGSAAQAGEQAQAGAAASGERPPYGERTAVVVSTAADIYEDADNTSRRLTQILFDQPVSVLEPGAQWAKVETLGGAQGWTRARNVDGDWACIDRRRYEARIVITSKNKQIYSHPRNGIVVRDVGMGTELFVISKAESVYEVALPGNMTGWLSENGTFQLDAAESIKKTTAEIFAQSCEKFRGTSYLQGGVSFQGIDGAGLLYAAMKINGVPLPHDLGGQMLVGEGVGAGEAAVGDVFFFSAAGLGGDGNSDGGEARFGSAAGGAGLSDAGVYVGDGKFLHASQHAGKVMYDDISDPYYQQRLYSVRRYF